MSVLGAILVVGGNTLQWEYTAVEIHCSGNTLQWESFKYSLTHNLRLYRLLACPAANQDI